MHFVKALRVARTHEHPAEQPTQACSADSVQAVRAGPDSSRPWMAPKMAPKKRKAAQAAQAGPSAPRPSLPEAASSGDLELEVEGQRLRVHSQLLALASPVLRGLLESCKDAGADSKALKVCVCVCYYM